MSESKFIVGSGRSFALLAVISLLLVFLFGIAIAAEPAHEEVVQHPAFGPLQTSQLTVESNVADVVKLEAKAVEILKTKYGLTIAQARTKVRIDGKTDVARCLEFIIINALSGITQAQVVGTVVGNQHPEQR